MRKILHLIDSRTPTAAAAPLAMLKRYRPADVIASLGPLDRPDLPAPDMIIRQPLPRAFTSVTRVNDVADDMQALVHCWNEQLTDLIMSVPNYSSVFVPPSAKRLEAMRVSARKGSFLIASSEYLADSLRAAKVKTAAVQQITPVAEAVAKERRTSNPPASLASDKNRRLVLLTVPQHDRDQGPYWSVWALGLVQQISDELELVICGESAPARKAYELARLNNLLDRVRMVSDAQKAWAAADVAILYDGDGVGMTGLAQAVANHLPVIASDCGELSQRLAHERTALLAKPAAPLMLARAIWRLVREPALAARLADGRGPNWRP